MANFIFGQLKICAGGDNYTFVEIEFYYHDDKKFDSPIYNCTYPRSRDAGKFFWHNSGVDICFESKEDKGFFGGILIRSLMKNDKEIITGPMRCANELKNSCNEEISNPRINEKELKKSVLYHTIRYGIEDDENQSVDNPKLFCYYILPESWTRIRNDVWVMDTKLKAYRKVDKKSDYYSAQPNKRKFAKPIEKICINT